MRTCTKVVPIETKRVHNFKFNPFLTRYITPRKLLPEAGEEAEEFQIIICWSFLTSSVNRAVKVTAMGKVRTHIYSRKLLKLSQMHVHFVVMHLKNVTIIVERLPSVVVICFFQWQIFAKWGAFVYLRYAKSLQNMIDGLIL